MPTANTTPLTDAEREALTFHWPVERPNEQPLGAVVDGLVARELLYIEDVGNGWRRIGLTQWGQTMAANIRDPFRRVRP